jgi:hypothetical protein
MSVWTTEDREAIKCAIKTAALEGYAELEIADQRVRRYSLDELMKLLATVEADLATGSASPFGKCFQLVSPGCGG